MNEFLQMQIFFIVTTVAVLVFVLLAALLVWRINRILKNIEHITGQVAAESDSVRVDLAVMRSQLRQGMGKVKALFTLITKVVERVKKTSK